MQDKIESIESLDLAKIEGFLQTKWMGRVCELWKIIDSTNNRALELARAGTATGSMVIANQQKSGRGRSSNIWYSPADSGLYLSFIVKPEWLEANLPVVTLIVGVAVVQAIESCLGIKVGLKWVNDLILEGKKVGGILVEYQGSRQNADNSSGLIIGIGLNLFHPELAVPPELSDKIGYLQSSFPGERKLIDRNKLVASIANELEIVLEKLKFGEVSLLLNLWRAYSITLGKEIRAVVGEKEIKGQAIDITDNGELIVKTTSVTITLPGGEVSVRKADGSYV